MNRGEKSTITLQDTAAKIKSYLADRSDVLLAFVFGSTVSGRTSPSSDIDIALLFSTPPDAYGINDLRDELGDVLKKEVDIAVLNVGSPILKMQVLKSGVPVLKRNAAVYNAFFVDTLNQYDDLKQTRRVSEESILKGRIYA